MTARDPWLVERCGACGRTFPIRASEHGLPCVCPHCGARVNATEPTP